MLEGFDFGAPETIKYLTGSLETLNLYNGLTVPAEYFEEAMNRLCSQFLTVSLSEVLISISPKEEIEVLEQQKAIAMAEPVSKETLTAWEWFERAYQAKKPEDKFCLYSKAIELNEGFVEAYYNRGNSYADLKQYERAITDYEKAIRSDTNYATEYINRGISWVWLKQYDKAISDYDQVLCFDPEHANAYYNKACAFALQEKIQESIQWLQEDFVRDKEKYCELSKNDSDFDAIRDEPEFQQLLAEFYDC